MKHDKIVLLAKSKSAISHDELVLINNVLKEYNERRRNKKFNNLIKCCHVV